MMRFLWSAAVALLAATVAAVPDDFEEEQLIKGVSFMTDIVFTPDAKFMYVAQKDGWVRLYEDEDGDYDYKNGREVLDISDIICENGERGMGGIQLHPKFGTENRWIYLYFTWSKFGNCDEDGDDGAVNRLSRFEVLDDMSIDPDSEVPFFDTKSLTKGYHNGGRIEFGKDGYLYVTSGDGGKRTDSQDPTNLIGGVIRLTDDNQIPPDNPFVGQPDAVRCNEDGMSGNDDKCLELYAVGLRNPFRFSMDPNAPNVRFFVNDVGASNWEEMSVGGDDFVGTGYREGLQNFGWPIKEGPCDRGDTSGCGEGAAKGGDFIEPYHFYAHDNGGAAVGSAVIPNGLWPPEYDNGYLFGEHIHGKIILVQDVGEDHDYGRNPPRSGKDTTTFTNYDGIVSLRFGPWRDCKQALYYTSIHNGGVLRRITYEGDFVSSFSECPLGTSATDPPVAGGNETETTTTTAPPTAAPTLPPLPAEGGYPGEMFPWASGDACPDGFDYCGMLEFCMGNSTRIYGYRLPCLEDDCPCPGISGPLIRLVSGNKYRLTLRNAAPESVITNLHTHGLHIVGDGDGDDVIRQVTGGGNCLDYTWDLKSDHPGGTYWYHAHHHGLAQMQVEGGAFGLLIVEDNTELNPDVPAWAANERLLQVVFSSVMWEVFGNGKSNEVIDIDANQWYRLRVSIVDSDAVPRNFTFDDQGDCTIHKVAADGIWRSAVPGPSASVWELTGASRADFAIQCATPNTLVPIYYEELPAATIRVGSVEANPDLMGLWIPERPYSLRDLRVLDLPVGNTFDVRLGYDYVNDLHWDPDVPIATIGFDQVHEWTLMQTVHHPFHIHLYHMQVVSLGGCGAHEEGEWYDTISSPENCTVRFNTADIGQRCVLHCHVLFHEDNGSMTWVNVTGPNMPRNDVQSFQYQCPAINYQGGTTPTQAPQTPAPQCLPGFLGVDSSGTDLVRGTPYVNEEYGVYITQQGDGNLVVYQGTPDARGEVVWDSSEVDDGSGLFFTTLQEDGHLITWTGTPDNRGSIHWSNEYTGATGDYFLGIDCNSEFVSVYQGSPSNPGPAVWNSAPTPPPTALPTSSPTASPTGSPTQFNQTPSPTASPTLPAPTDVTETNGDEDGETSSTSRIGLSALLMLCSSFIMVHCLV